MRRFLLPLLLASALHAADEKPLTPPESLVLEGIPPIPASLPDEVRRYTEARSALFLSWDPKMRGMLITTRFANTAQIHRVSMPGGARTQQTFYGEPVRTADFD